MLLMHLLMQASLPLKANALASGNVLWISLRNWRAHALDGQAGSRGTLQNMRRRSVVVIYSGFGLINEVNRHWARLVLGWVTVCGRVNYLGM